MFVCVVVSTFVLLQNSVSRTYEVAQAGTDDYLMISKELININGRDKDIIWRYNHRKHVMLNEKCRSNWNKMVEEVVGRTKSKRNWLIPREVWRSSRKGKDLAKIKSIITK